MQKRPRYTAQGRKSIKYLVVLLFLIGILIVVL